MTNDGKLFDEDTIRAAIGDRGVRFGGVVIYPPLPGDLSPTLLPDDCPLAIITPEQLGEGWHIPGKFGELIRMPYKVVLRRSDGIVVVDPRGKRT